MMSDEWQKVRQANGICTHDCEAEHDAAMTEIRNDYRWTPACQRAFLEELVCTGSVLRSTKHVGKSPRSAYNLRFRRDGAAFRLGWDAAILISRDIIHDMLLDRAVNGYEEVTSKLDDATTMRGKFDNRLGYNLLGRLDRLAEAQALGGSRDAQLQLIVQDFESFLDLIERGGKGSEAALFVAARDQDALAEPSLDEERAIDCELGRISAGEEVVPDMFDEAPELAAQRLSVWYDDERACWMTNFPMASDAMCDFVSETGFFGDEDYERTLSDAEETAHLAALRRERQPWIDAAAAARDAWFADKMAA
jgi:hypothetical protein